MCQFMFVVSNGRHAYVLRSSINKLYSSMQSLFRILYHMHVLSGCCSTSYPADAGTTFAARHPSPFTPLKYPIGCPKITAELLRTAERKGSQWLKHGRGAFIDGLRDGTIPRNCTTRPFKSTMLGLYYEKHCAEFLAIPERYVKIDPNTGSVEIVGDPFGFNALLEINSDDSEAETFDKAKDRFGIYEESGRPKNKPIIASRAGAMAWDERMLKGEGMKG